MTINELSAIVVAIAAFTGMVLGIYNFFHERKKSKVRLRVTPRAAHYMGHTESGQDAYLYSSNEFEKENIADTLVVEVINLSTFPVIVDEVGLTRKWTRRRMAMPLPKLVDGKGWPRKLDARERVVAHFDLVQLMDQVNLKNAKAAYAKTACGALQAGSSKALNDLVRIFRKAT